MIKINEIGRTGVSNVRITVFTYQGMIVGNMDNCLNGLNALQQSFFV